MGRRAKYLNPAERQTAERARKARYASSIRGRLKRQNQNSKAYYKKRGRHTSKSSLSDQLKLSSVPNLPLSLISLAAMPLPTSNLFHEASCSADALDESDLWIWEQEPPYKYPETTMTAHEVQYTKNMADVMLGRRWRLSKAVRDERALRFVEGKAQELLAGILRGLAGRIHRWTTAASHVGGMGGGRNREMADCWLCWQARDIVSDSEEANILIGGGNPYCT
ncbi:hypothetical protein EDD15DRAFT_2367859 [Pisolithus albus]|nr:hypothetical protein EDD15DRAFT_2367859 [Pisolithus albus]